MFPSAQASSNDELEKKLYFRKNVGEHYNCHYNVITNTDNCFIIKKVRNEKFQNCAYDQ